MSNSRLSDTDFPPTSSFLRLAPLAAVGAALAVAPVLGSDDGPILCFSRRHTDVACPGCGLTRGVASLVKGDVRASLDMHPLSLILVAQAIVIGSVVLWASRHALDKLWGRWVPAMLLFDLVAMLVIWIVRYNNGTLPLA